MKFYNKQRKTPTVIIVSLIDIFVILLIFVIVTTTFKKSMPSVVIKLPESETATESATPIEPVVLSISKKEEIFLDTKPVTLEGLPVALREMKKGMPRMQLALNADTDASFGFVLKVMDILKAAGVQESVSAFTESNK